MRERLVDWYREAGRDLPWRASRDAYRILVSEMMLVQTTVAAVIPFFERFISRFPDVAALAAADEAEVVKAWEGLGYYRRARQLHAAARTIVREHGGVIPDDPAAVRALPGVGRYIAGAILSFAMDRPEPIVEANSQRVLARLLAVREDIKVASTRERLWQAAARLVPAENAGAFNQALMDLGALVCTPREPGLPDLPVVAALPGTAAWPSRSAAGNEPEGPSVGCHGSGRGRGARSARPDPQARAGRTLGAILGIPDRPPGRGQSGRPVRGRRRRSARIDLSRHGDHRANRTTGEDDRLQRHQAPGEADRASGRGAIGRCQAGPWPGRRPLGRARKAGRLHVQLGRSPADRMDSFLAIRIPCARMP